jgi:hypothetical protein
MEPSQNCLQSVIQMSSCFPLSFENGHQSIAIQVQSRADLEMALAQFHLPIPCATLVVVGGANGLTSDYLEQLRSLFQEVLCPLAEQFGLAVVDGGTDAGVMQLMGQARLASNSTFPLIGVVVQSKAILPECIAIVDQDAADLEAHHTHFVLVPGEEWGDESHWIGDVADRLTGAIEPSVTVLINGGEIALNQDVPNSLEQGRPVLVIAGSGMAADELAAAKQGKTDDPDIRSMAKSSLLSVVDLTAGTETIRHRLETLLKGTVSL